MQPAVFLEKIITPVDILERVLAGCLAIAFTLAISVQVILRFFFISPVAWVEEASMAAFIWMSFLGTSIALRRGRHIVIQTFGTRLPENWQRVMRILILLVVGVICMELAILCLDIIPVENQTLAATLPFPVPRGWFFSAALFASSCSMVLSSIYLIVAELSHLPSGWARGPALEDSHATAGDGV